MPDAPISGFELNLPEGPYSALAANVNLCEQKLVMPTTIVGPERRHVTQSTRIAVTGCAKPTVKVTKTKIKGTSMLVTVETNRTGVVQLSGIGVVAKTAKNLDAGSHRVELVLTRTGRSLAEHHRRVKLRARLTVEKQTVAKTTSVKL